MHEVELHLKIWGRREIVVLKRPLDKARAFQLEWINADTPEKKNKRVEINEGSQIFGSTLGEIKACDIMETPQESAHERMAREEREEDQRILKLSPAQRAKERLGVFRVAYWRATRKKAEDDPALMKKAEKVATEYFKEYPNRTTISSDPFRKAGLLPDSARVDRGVDPNAKNGRKCEGCGKDLTGNLLRFCSGDCKSKVETITGDRTEEDTMRNPFDKSNVLL